MRVTDLLLDHLALDGAVTRALRSLPAETAHNAAMRLLAASPAPTPLPTPTLARTVAGLAFPNPIGVAAGFDKEARVFDRVLAWGFGFVEVGTVTPRPQAGNPKPRLFRLPEERAVINRFGFNNPGHDVVRQRLAQRDRNAGIVGVNIGCNKDADDPFADFAVGVDVFAELADYLTVNISSPNTPGLRDLQQISQLERLLDVVLSARARTRRTPIFVKLAPDVAEPDLEAIVALIARSEIDGVIYANTTIARPSGLQGKAANELGGLSGPPLMASTTTRLPKIRATLGPEKVLIGVGGIAGAADVRAKLDAGADLVQLYTGLVYGGLGLGRRMLRALEPAS